MRQGLKKFNAKTQGARTRQGQKEGEEFIKNVLSILSIKDDKDENKCRFEGIVNEVTSSMTPDFVISASETSKKYFGNINKIFLESKFKQIQGSDWEKIESNFGYHEWFYDKLCNQNCRTIVILFGFWSKLQKNYFHFMKYFKSRYGENRIFDFGYSVEEIYRFAKLMDINLTENIKQKIKNLWSDYFTEK